MPSGQHAAFPNWPAPPSRPTRRRGLWVALGALLSVALVAGLVAAAVLVGRGTTESDSPSDPVAAFAPGDDSVHPDEAASIPRPATRNLAPMPTEPTVRWQAPAGPNAAWAADESLIVLGEMRDSPAITVLDAATGRQRFVAPLPAGRVLNGCAINGERIACLALIGDNARVNSDKGLLMVWDARNGAVLARTELPGSGIPENVRPAGDRFVVSRTATSGEQIGTAIGLDLAGKVVWNQPGSFVAADQPIVIRTDNDGPNATSIALLRASDGTPIVELTTNTSAVPWTAYAGGVAIRNARGTGTDFYAADGTKTASLAGWAPTAEQNSFTTTAPLVPVLGRISASHSENTFTIGAANPRTGHLLWKKTGSEFNSPRMTALAVGDLLGMRIGTPGGPTTPVRDNGSPLSGDGPMIIVDPLTGQNLSPAIAVPRALAANSVLSTDGQRVIAGSDTDLIAFDIATGVQAWRYSAAGNANFESAGTRVFESGSYFSVIGS